MPMFRMTWGAQVLLMAAVVLLLMPNGAAAFGAGNIPSIGSYCTSEKSVTLASCAAANG